jgi:hypothetical protein
MIPISIPGSGHEARSTKVVAGKDEHTLDRIANLHSATCLQVSTPGGVRLKASAQMVSFSIAAAQRSASASMVMYYRAP